MSDRSNQPSQNPVAPKPEWMPPPGAESDGGESLLVGAPREGDGTVAREIDEQAERRAEQEREKHESGKPPARGE